MNPMRRKHDRSWARPLVAFMALVALALQAFIVQPHVHGYAPLAPFAFESAAEHAADGHAHLEAQHEEPGCIICQGMAASHMDLPGAVAVVAPTYASQLADAALLRAAPRTLALPWQSRAPPIRL